VTPVNGLAVQVVAGLLVLGISALGTWTLHKLREDFDQHLRETRRAADLSRDNADVLEDHDLIQQAETDHVRKEAVDSERVRLAQMLITGEIDPEEFNR
jgi:hypothetical protein